MCHHHRTFLYVKVCKNTAAMVKRGRNLTIVLSEHVCFCWLPGGRGDVASYESAPVLFDSVRHSARAIMAIAGWGHGQRDEKHKQAHSTPKSYTHCPEERARRSSTPGLFLVAQVCNTKHSNRDIVIKLKPRFLFPRLFT